MRVLVTMLNQIAAFFLWGYFTHYFLVPKESGWKREFIALPFCILLTLITATVLYAEILFKLILTPVYLFLLLCYIYQWDLKKFLITLVLIFCSSFLIDLPCAFMIIVFFDKQLIDANFYELLACSPIIFSLLFFIFSWILKRSNSISRTPNISILFFLSQGFLGMTVVMSLLSSYQDTILYPCCFLILTEVIFQIQFWKNRDTFIYDQKEKRLNKQLQSIYQEELQAYLEMKNETEIYRTLRHDLLNEIEIITYIDA